jgi:hypothetical protein
MYLRPHHRDKDGKRHTYWSLVETIRTADGPRQRTLCHLGELNDSAQARWLKTIEVFNEDGERHQLKLFPSDVAPPPDDAAVAQVLVQRVRLERTRQLGPALLGLALWRQLRLDKFFETKMDAVPADVPWSRVAAVLAINRLCAPGSELAIEERWYPTTALDDLLHLPDGTINDSRLYRTLDHLLPHKAALERHLTTRYGELFAAEFDVLLYDLTSSYVEGAAPKNPMMRRGYSRDHRPDCLQVILAVIVNVDGFPLSYETFDGNRADVTTLETVMRMVERKYGQARRVWVFDRGIVSDANLAAIRRRGGQYLVGTRRTALRHVERAAAGGPLDADPRGGRSATRAHPGRHRNLRAVSIDRAAREGACDSAPLLDAAGRPLARAGAAGRHRPAERPREDRARTGPAASVVRQRRRSL